MKKLLYGFIGLLLVSCGNGDDNASSPADSATSQATTADNTNTTGTTNASSGLKGVMDKMMQDMHSMKMTGDADHDFAMMMKSHHQGAIDMANYELSNGKNEELKKLAQKIINDAGKDNTDLEKFLSSHQPDANQSDYSKKAMDIMMKGDMNMDHGSDVDMGFAMMMKMHHQHGIDMAKEYLKSAKAAETKKVANNTIKSNSEDIKTLNKWENGNKSGTTTDHSNH